MVRKKKEYTEKDIQVLSDRDHVRLRLPVYAGSTAVHEYEIPIFSNGDFHLQTVSFVPAAYKCVGEIIDNCIDEFAQTTSANKHITIEAQPLLGTYTISDNGRGVPIGKHETGKYTPEVVFGSLRSGRNFVSDKSAGVIGMNGMGSSITCFCSTEFAVDIHRDGKRYRQKFTDGALNVSRPSIRSATSKNKTGTSIGFQLDGEVFSDVTLPAELMENRAVEIALTNPGVTAEYNKKKFKFKKGFDDVVRKISKNYFKFEIDNIEFYVIFDFNSGVDEKMFSWVNSSFLFDGGSCNTQFLNAFCSKVGFHLEKRAKKENCIITRNDIRRDLLIFGNLKISDPEYDAQSKTRMTGPSLRKEMDEMIATQWSTFAKKHKDWFDVIIERATLRHHATADKKAAKEHKKKNVKKVEGLMDATSKMRHKCQLLITEGDSAASMITDARDPDFTGVLPARGKFNNVYGKTVAQLLKMGKITDILTAIGLVPGERAVRSNLRYGRVVIATDADVDGGDIFTLFVNLFYQFWPELFDPDYEPFIYRLVAPNVCLTKSKQRIHFTTRMDYEKQRKYKTGWTVTYYKGLGSMVREDWEMILTGETDTMIPIIDDGNMKETLALLFSDDADKRKEWLQHD